MKRLIKDDGKLILEIPDLNSLINSIGFDTIYHEHRHYFSESSVYHALKKHGLYWYKIQKNKLYVWFFKSFCIKEKLNIKKIKQNFFD